jgi:RNA polymerase sigma factor (sigma-70 family)
MTAELGQFGVRAQTNDDLDLVQASKNGNVAAFEQLVKRYDRKLFRIAHSVTHNREDSQDAVQEAFLKAFQNLGRFRGDSQFSTWLIRITVNQSLMKLRKQRAIREVSIDEDFQADGHMLPMEVTDWAPNPEQLYPERSAADLANGLRAARSRRPFNGSDCRSLGLESCRCEVAAMASPVAASRTPEQVLRQASGTCGSRVNFL